MIQFSLIYRNGSQQGKRVVIDTSEFVIGRHAKTNLPLESRSISRRHCVIIQREGMVIVIDLGGRNPTLVNGQPLSPNKPKRLSDRDKLQIGRIKFRFRIEEEIDIMADEPSWSASPNKAPSGPLLDELSEIATSFGVGLNEASADAEDTQQTTTLNLVRNLFPSPTSPEEAEQGLRELEAETRDVAETMSITDTVGNIQAAEQEEDTVGPKKLPEHLRPKGPANSQNAAELALRNMFNRR